MLFRGFSSCWPFPFCKTLSPHYQFNLTNIGWIMTVSSPVPEVGNPGKRFCLERLELVKFNLERFSLTLFCFNFGYWKWWATWAILPRAWTWVFLFSKTRGETDIEMNCCAAEKEQHPKIFAGREVGQRREECTLMLRFLRGQGCLLREGDTWEGFRRTHRSFPVELRLTGH